FIDASMCRDAPVLKHDAAIAPLAQELSRVRGEHEYGGAADELVHPALRLLQKPCVAGGKPFVHDQDFRRHAGGDGKSQSHHHAGGVGARRHVDVRAKLGELDDFIHTRAHLAGVDVHVHATQYNVFAASSLGVEANRYVE